MVNVIQKTLIKQYIKNWVNIKIFAKITITLVKYLKQLFYLILLLITIFYKNIENTFFINIL